MEDKKGTNTQVLTSNRQGTTLGSANDPHPGQGKQTNPDNRTRTDQEGKAKENSRNDHVVQVKEGQVVTQPFHEKRRSLFDIEGSLFADTKVHCDGANVFTLEDVRHVVLGAVGYGSRHATNGFVRATRVPFFFSVGPRRQMAVLEQVRAIDQDGPVLVLSLRYDGK